jgi:endoglucanase
VRYELKRRDFLRTTGAATGLLAVGALNAEAATTGNALPRWRGFNLLDLFAPGPSDNYPRTSEEELQWIADWGFDFVRLPMAYPRYVKFERSKDIRPEDVCNFDETEIQKIEALVGRAHRRGLHVSLNLHRAPGYCVNAGFKEPYDLWRDEAAQKAFNTHWAMWAKRFTGVSRDKISFDLVNEPGMREDMNDQHSKRGPVPGPIYRRIAQGAAEAIWAQDAKHRVVADGNDTGSSVIPEIADLAIAQSCRGYFPHYVSHYQAPWVFKDPKDAPLPVWPGVMDGKRFGRESLEEFYRPWIELVRKGVGVHCGECGCWKRTPHAVFLAWFGDILDILKPHGIGYALWQFRGDFGILDSGRTDIAYEDWHGRKLDRGLLKLLQKY